MTRPPPSPALTWRLAPVWARTANCWPSASPTAPEPQHQQRAPRCHAGRPAAGQAVQSKLELWAMISAAAAGPEGAFVRTHTSGLIERITSASTVERDLGKRRSAQRLPAFKEVRGIG